MIEKMFDLNNITLVTLCGLKCPNISNAEHRWVFAPHYK